MTKDFSSSLKDKLRSLYNQDETAQNLLDWLAKRKRDASSTSVDRMCTILKASRGEAVRIARELANLGCGEFKNGRRGQPSRLEWSYSCISLGRAAAGEPSISIEKPTDPISEEDEDLNWDDGNSTPVKMTIPEAKAAIAASLGISPDQVEISIKA